MDFYDLSVQDHVVHWNPRLASVSLYVRRRCPISDGFPDRESSHAVSLVYAVLDCAAHGGFGRTRTGDTLLFRQVLFQLSYET